MGNGLQDHYITPAFHLHAVDLYLRNVDVTQMIATGPSDIALHLRFIYMLQVCTYEPQVKR
ncbi:hypothetical protein HAX54_043820, partial [Datura stramonium]|nr:hypothetical protein [Datura stramonium]